MCFFEFSFIDLLCPQVRSFWYQTDAMFSAEEMMCSTQQVIAGLEALRGENCSLLENLQEPQGSLQTLEHGSVKQEKCSILRQSLERIELGLSEAQVPSDIMCIIKTKSTSIHVQG